MKRIVSYARLRVTMPDDKYDDHAILSNVVDKVMHRVIGVQKRIHILPAVSVSLTINQGATSIVYDSSN